LFERGTFLPPRLPYARFFHAGRQRPILNLVNADFKASLIGSRQASLGTVIRAGPDEQPERLGGRSAEVLIVARLARVLAVGVPHHVTQRGNARRFILDCDGDSHGVPQSSTPEH
jgi:hypothetical protein